MNKLQSIHTTALKLFVEFGFHGTPTAKIAKDAAVANGTLFHYYNTKDDLVVGLYNTVREELAQSINIITYDSEFIIPKLKKVYVHIIRWAINNPAKFYYIHQFQTSPHKAKISVGTIQQHSAVVIQLFTEAIRKKLLQPRALDLILIVFNNQLFGVYQYITSQKLEADEQERIINDGYEMMWEMLKFR